MHRVHCYHSHRMELKGSNKGALVDRGANGGTCGDDVRVIEKSHGIVDVRGIDNHEMPNTPIVTAGGVVHAQSGEVIAIMHQCAHIGQGKTIHSCGQMEHHGLDVCDKSMKVSGKQRIQTQNGYCIPLSVRTGLPHMPEIAFLALALHCQLESMSGPAILLQSHCCEVPPVHQVHQCYLGPGLVQLLLQNYLCINALKQVQTPPHDS